MSKRKFDEVHASDFLSFQECSKCKETIYAAAVGAKIRAACSSNRCDHKLETVQTIEEHLSITGLTKRQLGSSYLAGSTQRSFSMTISQAGLVR